MGIPAKGTKLIPKIMAKILNRKRATLLLFFLLTLNCFAQLPNFTVTATSTPETCPGNGALSFTVAGTDPLATIDYAVYLGSSPTPIAVVTTPSLGSLEAGAYTIIATQSLGGQSNTSTTTVTIADQTNPLTYTFSQVKACGTTGGTITVNITSGTAVSFEIISGPVTRPLQTSNVFASLPVGQYQVRIIDGCASVYVVTFQISPVAASMGIDLAYFQNWVLPSCNTVVVSHDYVSTGTDGFVFPLTFQYTVFPPGGGTPTIVTQVVPNGSTTDVNTINSTIPFYNNQQYSYNIQVTDACGNVFNRNNNIVNNKFDVLLVPDNPECNQFKLTISPQFFMPPYTVTFITAPAGFVPTVHNAAHPTFSSMAAIYGTEANPMPLGTYSVQVTDACGRSVTKDITLANDTPPSVTTSSNPSTCLGQVTIVLSGRPITTVVVTAAPASYGPVPDDVSDNIAPTGFQLGSLPFGNYTFQVTDACNVVYNVNVNLQPTAGDFVLEKTQRAGCEVGNGSLRLRIGGGVIDDVVITAAPAGFTEPLPYTASFIDGAGIFYMNSLPEGNYTFVVTNICGIQKTENITIEGYHVQTNNVNVIPHCGSFDLQLQHASNGNYVESYWLQKYNTVTGTWGHPSTGTAYVPGNLPTAANSVFLINNTTNMTLVYSGQFRVVKAFHIFSNGNSSNTRCIEVLEEFIFDGQVHVESVYGFPCVNNTSEVIVDAVGVAPLTYAIVDTAGNVLVNNGTSNVFQNLTAGTYIIRVSDPCGSSQDYPVDVNELAEIEITETNLCEGENGQLSVTQFSFLTYEWWEEGNPTDILSTAAVLPLSPFDPVAHAGTYFVRISSSLPSSCIDDTVLSYVVAPDIANPGEDNSVVYCNDGEALDLVDYLTNPHDTDGVWTDIDASGALNGSVLTTAGLAEGIYHFSYGVTDSCGNVKEAIITIDVRNRPVMPMPDPVPAICEGEDIQLTLNIVADEYQWTGPNNFSSTLQNPLIELAGLSANGTYQVSVTVNGCTSPIGSVNVTVNAVPNFTIEGNTSLCEGQSSLLAVAGQNFDEASSDVVYEWYHNDVLITDALEFEITVSEIGEYKVIVSNNGCVTEQFVNVTENTNAFAVELTSGCVDFDYIITVANTADLEEATYAWSGPGGFTASGTEIVITDGLTGDYTVVVTNTDGCSAEATQNVTNTRCMIPKGISPGDADYNNSFDLSNMEVEQLKIYNRYGMEVYGMRNYTNQWHGQSNKGNELPTGTYYYDMMLASGKRLTGWVYINRAN